MGSMRRRARVDSNQPRIVAALRQVGASVESLHRVGGGVPDILVGFRGENFLLEIKNPDGLNRIKPEQEAWHCAWRGLPVAVVRSVDEALAAIGVK